MTGKNDHSGKPEISGQRLIIIDRKSMELTGVEDVISFDENGAVLKTCAGTLAVDGEGLHVTRLDLDGGVILFDGKINGLFYSEVGGVKNKTKRLFR